MRYMCEQKVNILYAQTNKKQKQTYETTHNIHTSLPPISLHVVAVINLKAQPGRAKIVSIIQVGYDT